jgi:DNA-3-methyladenine glycosylase
LEPLPRRFYDRNAIKVAPELVGCLLARRGSGGWLLGRVVEAEAYVGEHDLACHSRAGRTARTEVMYGAPGHAYVYLIYGIHKMLNVVCGPGDDANAVLIRAVEPVENSAPWLHRNAIGPGNVCTAFGIEMRHNCADLCDARGELLVLPRVKKPRLGRSARVGVDYAGDWAAKPFRFFDLRSEHVSGRRK